MSLPPLTRPLLFLGCAALGAPERVLAQDVGGTWWTSRQHSGYEFGAHLGESVAAAGDVDADGVMDFVFGAWSAANSVKKGDGAVWVYSGRDGALLLEVHGRPRSYERFGAAVAAAGDVDHDGFDDLIVGAPLADVGNLDRAGAVALVSGRDGSELWRVEGDEAYGSLGHAVAAAGDLDGDGTPDYLVGEPFASAGSASDAGAVHVLSGVDGSSVDEIFGSTALSSLGYSLDSVSDLDGDSVRELLLGSKGGGTLAGEAFVLSGASRAIVFAWSGTTGWDYFGESVAAVGDINADGWEDVLVGAPGVTLGTSLQNAGAAYLYSGRNGSLIHRLDGDQASGRAGSSLAGGLDFDEDGVLDLLVGAPNASHEWVPGVGRVTVHSGVDGRPLHTLTGEVRREFFGDGLATLGDLDGDGHVEIAFGAPRSPVGSDTYAGIASVRTWFPGMRTSAETLSASGGPPVDVAIDFPPSEAGQRYALLVSASGAGPIELAGVAIPLSWDPLLVRMLGGWRPPPVASPFGSLDADGDADAGFLPSSALAPYVGRTLHTAAISYDAATAQPRASSVGVAITVLP